MTAGAMEHVPVKLLGRYAVGGADMQADVLWAVEAHLDSCGTCRQRLGQQIGPEVATLLDDVRAGLAAELPRSARMSARRRRVPAAPALLPRIAMTVLVALIALGLDLVDRSAGGGLPSLVLLVAPVAPLLGVAAAWSRGLDPAHELVTASPRAGLSLVLRRTLAVLVVVVPILFISGSLAGVSPARWLLPCLAFTLAALALGEVIGLHRAANGLALLWAAGVVAPSLINARLPTLLEPASLPGWAALSLVVMAVLAARRNTYTGLASSR